MKKRTTNDVERKVVPFSLKGIEANSDGQWEFAGYAAVFGNVDRVGDVILQGAFKNTLPGFLSRGVITYQHDWAEPIGKPLNAYEDLKGLYVRGRLVDTQRGADCYKLMKEGIITSLSIGFKASKERKVFGEAAAAYLTPSMSEDERKKWLTDGVRLLEECELYEVSPVSVPANPEAVVTSVKAATPYLDIPLAPRDAEWDGDAAEARVREWAGAEEAPNEKYQRAFLWYDEGAPENFGNYKLPYADVIDGELTAVPRAIFAAAAAIQGGRGGVDIPEGDLADVKATVEAWYERMAREFDDGTIVAPWLEEGSAEKAALDLVPPTEESEEEVDPLAHVVGLLREALQVLESGAVSNSDKVSPMRDEMGGVGGERRDLNSAIIRAQELLVITGGIHDSE